MIVAVLGKELFLSCFMGIRTAFIRTFALSELLCYQSSCLTLSGLLLYFTRAHQGSYVIRALVLYYQGSSSLLLLYFMRDLALLYQGSCLIRALALSRLLRYHGSCLTLSGPLCYQGSCFTLLGLLLYLSGLLLYQGSFFVVVP